MPTHPKTVSLLIYTLWFALSCLAYPNAAFSKEEAPGRKIVIYQDADLSRHTESGVAIQRGIEVAFDEIGNEIQGYQVEFSYLDHRGNVVLSKKNFERYIQDQNGLAIFSGIHSPPLIKNRSFINSSKALTLVPWAAGAPITRHDSQENWIFRLSLDDSRVAPVIVKYAVYEKQCKSPRLLLERTAWGDGNLKTMRATLDQLGIRHADVERFGWNVVKENATMLLSDIIESGNDCIIFVGNAVEGAVFAESMLLIPESKRLPIISHWGIVGGNFHIRINQRQRQELDLSFIQSCFSFTNRGLSTQFSDSVFQRLKALYPAEISEYRDLKAAVGFIHAYDLTRLLIQAIEQIELTGNIEVDRDAVRLSLESLEKPVTGLIKKYQNPFSVFDLNKNPNAHEALDPSDYCMAKYGNRNEVLLLSE